MTAISFWLPQVRPQHRPRQVIPQHRHLRQIVDAVLSASSTAETRLLLGTRTTRIRQQGKQNHCILYRRRVATTLLQAQTRSNAILRMSTTAWSFAMMRPDSGVVETFACSHSSRLCARFSHLFLCSPVGCGACLAHRALLPPDALEKTGWCLLVECVLFV